MEEGEGEEEEEEAPDSISAENRIRHCNAPPPYLVANCTAAG